MKTYIGVKIIDAEPMDQLSFRAVVKGEKVENAEGADNVPGYKVIYPDGYVSWSPKETFEEVYREVSGGCMSFGLALEALKKGKFVRLPHWGEDVKIKMQSPDENSKMTAPYLYVESRYGRVPWKETMIELLSDEWIIVE